MKNKLERIIEESRSFGWDPDWLRNSLIPAVREAGGVAIDGTPVPFSVTVSLNGVSRHVFQDGRVERTY